jgi:uncharacterized protein (TIGR01777 family)
VPGVDVAVTGSRGLIGEALVESLRGDGHRVVRFVRGDASGPDIVRWDPAGGELDRAAVEGLDAVVHLAGENIDSGRWTEAQKRRLLESRTKGTSLLAEALARATDPPRIVVSASAIGYYGNRGDEWLTEESPPGEGFMADLVQAWEAAIAPAEAAGVRVVRLRSGVVLSKQGGALRKQLPLFRFGLGGPMGGGKQYLSWISIDDEVRGIRWLLEHDLAGPVNLTAPNPVTNAEFTDTLGAVLHRPTVLPIPRFGPRLVLGREMADEVLFVSQRVKPARLEAAGFTFAAPALEPALAALLAR